MTGLLVGFCCFILNVAVTLVWLRLPGRLATVIRHAVSALGTHLLVVMDSCLIVGAFDYWPAAAVSALGAVCWLFTYCAVYKSVSLRILQCLDRAPGNSMPLDTISREHVQPEFAARIAVLIAMGCVVQTDDGYTTTAKGIRTSRRIEAIQRLFGIEQSGLYGRPQESESARNATRAA